MYKLYIISCFHKKLLYHRPTSIWLANYAVLDNCIIEVFNIYCYNSTLLAVNAFLVSTHGRIVPFIGGEMDRMWV